MVNRETELCVINVYGSQSREERVQLFEQLRVFLVTNKVLLIMGDFNCGILIEDQKKGKIDKSGSLLKLIINDARLKDFAKCFCPSDPGYTWSNSTQSTVSRIDFCFVPCSINIKNFRLESVFFSDHRMLKISVEFTEKIEYGRGVWKLNCNAL